MLGSPMTTERSAATPAAVVGATSSEAATSATDATPPPEVEKPAQESQGAEAMTNAMPNTNTPAAAPAPQTTSGVSSPAPAAAASKELDSQGTAVVRNAVIAKLREAARTANAGLMREAISEAEAAGMNAEADLSKRYLASISNGAPRSAPHSA